MEKEDFLQSLQIQSSEEKKAHHTYQQEQLLWEKFKEGIPLEEISKFSQNITPGTMAKNSLKQIEYTSVTMITLLTPGDHRGRRLPCGGLQSQRPLSADAGALRAIRFLSEISPTTPSGPFLAWCRR